MHPARALGGSRAAGGHGRGDVPAAGPQGRRPRAGHDPRGGLHHARAPELRSYRELPQMWYQFQTKFRDEPRPKSGLLRVREFTMKDSYSFDLDAAGLDRSFEPHRGAYERIFARLGIDAMPVAGVHRAPWAARLGRVHVPVATPARTSWCTAAPAVTRPTSRRPPSALAGRSRTAAASGTASASRRPACARSTILPATTPRPADRQIKTLVYVARRRADARAAARRPPAGRAEAASTPPAR